MILVYENYVISTCQLFLKKKNEIFSNSTVATLFIFTKIDTIQYNMEYVY